MNNIAEKDIIKYFDIIIKEIDDLSFFSINNILIHKKYLNTDTDEQKDFFFSLVRAIESFGLSRGFFNENKGGGGWLKLTSKGIDLKDSKMGYAKFIKKAKIKPIDWYKIIAISLTVIFGSLNLYQKYDYNNLKSQYISLKTINEDLDNNILLKNSVNKIFSNPNKKDKFTISIIGESILKGEMVFK